MALTLEDVKKYREKKNVGTSSGVESVRAARERLSQGLPAFSQEEQTEAPTKFSSKRILPECGRTRNLNKGKSAIRGVSDPETSESAKKVGQNPPEKRIDNRNISRDASAAAKQYGVSYTGDAEETLRTAGRAAYGEGKAADAKALFEKANAQKEWKETPSFHSSMLAPASEEQPSGVDNIPVYSGRLHGKYGAGDYLSAAGHAAMGAISGMSNGIVQTAKAFNDLARSGFELVSGLKTTDGLQPLWDLYNRLDQNAQDQVAEDIRTGKISEPTYAIISGLTQQIPTVALAILSGGSSVAAEGASAALGNPSAVEAGIKALPQMFKDPQFLFSFTQTFGPTYQDARENGANPAQAFLAAVVDALPESAIEVGGGLETALAEGPVTGAKDLIGRIGKSALEEAGEEIRQDPFSGLARMTYDPGVNKVSLTDEDAVVNPVRGAKSAFYAFITSALSGGVGTTLRTAQDYHTIGTQVKESGNLNSMLLTAMDSQDETLRDQAADLAYQVKSGKKVSSAAVGKMALQVAEEVNREQTAALQENARQWVERHQEDIKQIDAAETAWEEAWKDPGKRKALLANAEESAQKEQKRNAAAEAARRAAEARQEALRENAVQRRRAAAEGQQGRKAPASVSMAEQLGENGRKAYEYTLEKSSGEEAGIRPAFLACYTYGLAGSPMENVPEEFKSALSGDAAYRAWASGQNDAAISLRNDQEKVKFASLAGEDSGLVYDDFVNEAVRSGRIRVDVNEENRTYLSAETAEQINETAKALGLRVQFADSVRGGTANAQISGDTILIEKDNPNPVLAIAGHEFGHRLQELAPEEYRRFRESILEGREQEVRDKAAQYAKQGVNVTYEEAMNEVANDQAGLLMDGGEVLDRFIEQHRSDRTLLQKMRDAIRSFIDKVTGKERKRLETAEGKLEAALNAAAREAKALQKKTAGDTMGTGKYSLKEDENNGTVRRNQTESEGAGTSGAASARTGQTFDTGRSGQNRQGVGSDVRSEVGTTVRREDFLREHRERGDRSVSLKNGAIYAYHEATETELNDNARKAVSILKELGIPCFTTTDGIHIYANGKTWISSQAVTIRDGSDVKVSISAKMGTEGVSTAYHEAFHFLGDIAPAIRNKLQGIIRESIVKNRSYETFANRIAEGYQIPLDPSQRTKAQEAKFQEELNAYICGEIMARNPGSEAWQLIRNFIPDTDSLYSAVVNMYTDFKTQQKGDAKFSLKTGTITKSYEAVLEENRLLKEQMKDYRSLKKQNRNLKENRDYWKGQTKTTKEVTTDRKAVEKAAAELLKSYSSEADVSDIQERLQNLYDSIARGDEGVSYEEAWKRAEAIAKAVIDKAVAKESLGESYQELLSYLKDTKIRVEEGTKSDIPDYSAFQRQQKGRLSLNSQDGTGIDQVYQELAERWPEFFDETEYTNPSDQLLQIADVADQLRQVEEYNPFEGDGMDQVVAGAANEILERFFDLPQTKKTFADRQEAKLNAAKAQGKQQVQKVREEYKERLDKLRQANRQRVADAIDRERGRADQKIRKLKEKYAARDAAGRERRNARELRAKIIRHTSELSKKLLHPSDKHHIPEKLRTAVSAMLESINLESPYRVDENGKRQKGGSGSPTRRMTAFLALKEQYARIAAEGGDIVIDPALFGDAALDIQGGFDAVISMKNIRLADMSTEQLQTVWQVVKAVEHSVSTAGKLLSKAKYDGTTAWASAISADTVGRRTKESLTKGHVSMDLENPYTFFSHYGEAGQAIFRTLRNAQDQQQMMKSHVAEEAGKIADPATVEKLEKSAHTFSTERGDTLTLSTDQVMELYELAKRGQARDHLLMGGIIQPEVKSARVRRGTDSIRLSEADLAAITGTLTQEQKQIADRLQEMTTGILADYGNEASMAAYGYKKFTGKDYWPINSAGEGLHSSVEKNQDRTRSIRNIGMAQATTPHANNPLELPGIFNTFADHVSDMTKYAAWLCTMEDMDRLFNYKFRDEKGNLTGKTMKGMLDRVGGPGSQKYWRNLMEDIQNGIGGSNDSAMWSMAGKAIGTFKAASVSGNIRVVIQQPTAFFRAADVLEAKDMTRGLVRGVTKGNGWEKALRYAPIAVIKDDGSFDISNPRQTKEVLFDGRSLVQKVNDTLSSPAGKADAITWGKLWNASEWAVAREHPDLVKGSEEFYRETARQFTEVIDQTQVVDGVLQRSNIMRSSNEVVKQATSFMGEPIMSLNMMMRAYDRARYETDPVKRKKAVKRMVRTASALVVTNVVNALVQSLVDAARDDDPDKDYAEKYREALLGEYSKDKSLWDNIRAGLSANLIENLNPLALIPFVKDGLSMMEGYEVKRMDTQGIAELFNVSRKWEKLGDGRYTVAYLLKDTAGSVSKLTGIPIGNVLRDLSATINTTISFADSFGADTVWLRYRLSRTMYDVKNSQNLGIFTGLIWEARQKGNEELASEIYNDLGRSGWTREQLDQRVNNLAQKAEKGAAAAQAYVDAEERGSASGMEKATETAGNLGISDDEFKAMLNKERNRRKEKDKEPEPWEDIGPDYWAGGNVSYSYDNLYQAVLNGDVASVETIRRALEQDGKDSKAIDSAVKSRLRADLKEAFWESGSLNDSEVKKLSRLLADWDDGEDAAAYLEEDAWKKWKKAYCGGKGKLSEYKRYYDVLNKVFGYENAEIIQKGKGGK